jgi:hypothetical protein
VLVLVDDASWDGKDLLWKPFLDAARELELESVTPWFTLHIRTLEWLASRREIKSFFIAEVDRDKVVVEGLS